VSLRISLSFAIPLLVALTGGSIALHSYLSTRANVERLATDVFSGVTSQTVAQTQGELQRAVPVVEQLGLLAHDGLSPTGSDALARQLTDVLRANPDLAWVSYSDEEGSFTGATHGDNGGWVVNQSRIVAPGQSDRVEHGVDASGAWSPLREALSNYDPRTRPFYLDAVKAGRRIWTPPYVFFSQGVPGISCALPDYGPAVGPATVPASAPVPGTTSQPIEQRLRGVFEVDFDLNGLSRFVAGLHFSDHGSVFIFTPDGTLLAHPTAHVVETVHDSADGALLTVHDVDDPLLQGYFASPDEQALAAPVTPGAIAPDGTWQFTFDRDGVRYYASYTRFTIDTGLQWVVGAVAPASDFIGSIEHENRVALAISGVALAIALLLSLLLSTRIVRPLTVIARDMDLVGQFELDERPLVRTRFREVHAMDVALRRMKGGLRSFASYVPRDLVRFMLASGQEARLEGHTRELTIFFSDIAGFTSIAEGLKPEDLVPLLGSYLDELTKIISAHGGTIDKYLGDGIMAFWGAPKDDPEHAARACQAALACQRRLTELAESGASWARSLSTRIGLATGDVLVGNFGTPDRLNYTVMGDTANLASRLEGLNKQYGTRVMVAESTYRAAREKVIARAVDLAAVKGKAQALRVYELVCLASDPDPTARELARLASDGLDAYLARDFTAAAACFERILGVRPGDRPAEILLARCRALQASPPPAEWTGVMVATQK
jgi:adenylate cyclase